MTAKTPSITASLIRNAENVTELEDWGPCPEATGPQMDTRGAYLFKDDENGIDTGIWECTAGPLAGYWKPTNFCTFSPGR